MREEHSLVMLKPDCLRRGLEGDVLAAVEAHGLRSVCRHDVTLTADQVRRMWSKIPPAEHPVSHLLFDLYLVDAQVASVLVAGPDAVERTLALKREVRRRFGKSLFANVLHTPDDGAELRHQLEVLADGCATCGAVARSLPEDTADWTPPPGSCILPLEVRTSPALAEAVHAVYDDPDSPLWGPAAPPVTVEDGVEAGWVVELRPDADGSIDNAVAALLDVIPSLSLRRAVELVVAQFTFDVVDAVVTDEATARRYVEGLRARQVKNTTVRPEAC